MKRIIALAAGLFLVPELASAQSSGISRQVIVNPGGGDPSRPLPRVNGWQISGDGMTVSFDGPAILQGTATLLTNRWQNLSLSSPFTVTALGGDRFACFRAVSTRRPVSIHVPASYDPAQPIPLLIALHAFSQSGDILESGLSMLPLAEEYGFAYCTPDGSMNLYGHRFWDSSDSCCDFFGSGVDDVSYLRELVMCAREQIEIDPKRVCLFGMSNGAFMAHRMAQAHSDIIAAVACMAGTMSELDAPMPQQPVSVLQIHATGDNLVYYAGGRLE